MGADEAAVTVLAGKFAELRPHMDERAWRVYLGSRHGARRERMAVVGAGGGGEWERGGGRGVGGVGERDE